MNIASRMARRAILSSRTLAQRPTVSTRRFSEPVAKTGQYNMIQRKGHGLMNYIGEWEALIFSHKEWRTATFMIWGPSAGGVGVMFYMLWNSAWRDPEVKLRPHKKSWHVSDERLANAEKYRGGGFIWYPIRGNRKRQEFIRKIQREGLGVAGFEEPGQIGFAENP